MRRTEGALGTKLEEEKRVQYPKLTEECARDPELTEK